MGEAKLTEELLPKVNIAIIGGSYAGLSLANTLHINSVSYTIFDRRSLPYNHVMGGSGFNVPSLLVIQDRLQLKRSRNTELHNITRKNVIDLLLERGMTNMISESNVVEINKEASSFYITTETKSNDKTDDTSKITTKHGPYQILIGADGVLSTCRKSSFKGMFLIGDAKWVNDRRFDLGLRRIDRGADIAMIDGLQLGEAICNSAKRCTDMRQLIHSVNNKTDNVFCAREIYYKKMMRQSALVVLLFGVLLKYLLK